MKFSGTNRSHLLAIPFLIAVPACTPVAQPSSPLPGTPTAHVSPSPRTSPAASRTPTQTQEPSATPSPTFTITPTATLGPHVTRTPAPAAVCPSTVADIPAIQAHQPSEDYSAEIASYLNAGATPQDLNRTLNLLRFTEGGTRWRAHANVLTADVTGDSVPDVVLDLLFFADDRPISGSGYVFHCANGRYQGGAVIGLSFGAYFADAANNSTIGLRSLPDMNSDGVPEVAFSYIDVDDGIVSIGSATDYARWFQLIEWDGARFVDLLPDYAFYGRNAVVVINGDGRFADADGDGYKELVLQGGSLREAGHGHLFFRASTQTWEWDGYGIALTCISYSAPSYRFQAVEDGDAALLCRDYEQAVASYQKAIFDESLTAWSDEFRFILPGEVVAGPTLIPDPEERPLLGAYSRYRIMLIHLAKGDLNAASIVYETLITSFPDGAVGHQYAELATVVWNEYLESQDLPTACQKALELANARENLGPLMDRYNYYSIAYSSQDYICPFD